MLDTALRSCATPVLPDREVRVVVVVVVVVLVVVLVLVLILELLELLVVLVLVVVEGDVLRVLSEPSTIVLLLLPALVLTLVPPTLRSFTDLLPPPLLVLLCQCW